MARFRNKRGFDGVELEVPTEVADFVPTDGEYNTPLISCKKHNWTGEHFEKCPNCDNGDFDGRDEAVAAFRSYPDGTKSILYTGDLTPIVALQGGTLHLFTDSKSAKEAYDNQGNN